MRVEAYRQASGWNLELYGGGDRFHLETVDRELATEDLYEGIKWEAGGG